MVTTFPSGAQRGHHTVEGCVQEWQVHCTLGVHPHPVDPSLTDEGAPAANTSQISDSASVSSSSSVTASTWDEIPSGFRFYVIWKGGVVYTDR